MDYGPELGVRENHNNVQEELDGKWVITFVRFFLTKTVSIDDVTG